MPYRYDAELTRSSVRNLYVLPPILIGASIYAAWQGWHALRTHTEIEIGQGKMNWPWWEGFLWSMAFFAAAIITIVVARISARRLREQERDQGGS